MNYFWAISMFFATNFRFCKPSNILKLADLQNPFDFNSCKSKVLYR